MLNNNQTMASAAEETIEETIEEMKAVHEGSTLNVFFPRMYGKKIWKQGAGWVLMTVDEFADYMRVCFEGLFLGDFLKHICVREKKDTRTGSYYFIANATFFSGETPTDGILRFIKNVKDLDHENRDCIHLYLPVEIIHGEQLHPFWKVIQDKIQDKIDEKKENSDPVLVVRATGQILPY